MRLLTKLENRFQHLAIPQITLFLVIGQAIFFLLSTRFPNIRETMTLLPAEVYSGQIWRLLTFVFIPPNANPLFVLIGLYFFYFMGTGLESNWGPFRYNCYLLLGYVATVLTSFVFPSFPAGNIYFEGSVLLAFAYCFPSYEFLLFFIIPCRMKWLGWFTGLLYAFIFVTGVWPERVQILAAMVPFVVFFGRDIFHLVRAGRRRMDHKMKYMEVKQSQTEQRAPQEAFHRCDECGITDLTHPTMDFRYCDECEGHYGFCSEHIRSHTHRKKTA